MDDAFYEVRPRSDKRGVNLISDSLPFGRLWTSPIAVAYAQQREFFTPAGAPWADASPTAGHLDHHLGRPRDRPVDLLDLGRCQGRSRPGSGPTIACDVEDGAAALKSDRSHDRPPTNVHWP